jgi:transposase-like protein
MAEQQSEKIRFLAGLKRSWTEEEAREVLGLQASSGLSVGEFCHHHELSKQRVHWWRAKLTKKEKGSPAVGQRFVQVRVKAVEATTRQGIELVLRGGRRVRVSGDFDEAVLMRLIAVLER